MQKWLRRRSRAAKNVVTRAVQSWHRNPLKNDIRGLHLLQIQYLIKNKNLLIKKNIEILLHIKSLIVKQLIQESF